LFEPALIKSWLPFNTPTSITKDSVTQKIHYVGDFALFISTGENPRANYKYEYLHRDHIGSIIAISKGNNRRTL
jgi:hypothetical protein